MDAASLGFFQASLMGSREILKYPYMHKDISRYKYIYIHICEYICIYVYVYMCRDIAIDIDG